MIIFGTGMHFVIENIPNKSVAGVLGLVFPVNETSWEHMKMIWYPFLVTGIFLTTKYKNRGYYGTFVLCGLGTMMIQLGAFAFYQSFVGTSMLLIDICIYICSMLFGSLDAFAIEKDEFFSKTWIVWIIISLIITSVIIYLTFNPGYGYIFLDNSGFEG